MQLCDPQSVTGSRVIYTHLHNSEEQRNYSFSSVALRVPLWNSIPHPPPILRQELQVHETKCWFSESVRGPCVWLVSGANIPALAYGSWAVQGGAPPGHAIRPPAFMISRMKHFCVLGLCVVLLFTCGCTKKMATTAPLPPPPSLLDSDSNLQDSLFKGDQAVLSDQEIARILGTQLKFGDRHRVAVLALGSTRWYSEDISDIESKNTDNLLRTLKSSPQLTEVRLLPSLLVPEKRTVPYLREAAARIQADLLFVYATSIQTFRRGRLLKPGEVHAQCIGESVLLDVRTGIVAQTAHATENIAATKTQADLNFDETVARAESEARGKALVSLANAVVAQLAQSER